ncbi:AAA family ATPase [Allocoleopsis sp.]|uniref:AAA family ATPase n=1 Tax=Allocoleopsis sp. TaxID=3088169 RepID=UPI002FD6B8EB
MTSTIVTLPGYRVIEKIYDGTRTLVYRGQQELDQKPVVLKLLKSEYPTFSELVQFRNQYTIAKNLDLAGIVQPLSLENYRNGFALIMEDQGCISLKDYTTSQPLSLVEFLNIAIQISQTLEGLYQNRVIHKDIKPQNILINPETKQVRLIDFSISSLLPRENQEIQNPNVLEGTLAYMSPEQTGRMNRGIDYRTDFYSLGVTFYELLSGQLPFQSIDPMELVHCHLARIPTPLIQVNPSIPQMVNHIIMKLMAKTAEERYQSAFGLKHDLEICRQQIEDIGNISPFPLGQRDISDRFFIPEKLYGRETEVTTLLAAFERVSQGNTEMMLVAGFSGIGKTAVVHEVHKPIVRQRGYFISGKFDQFKRNIPFYSLVQAFQKLMGQLLTESTVSLQEWKTKILSVLGENAQVMIDVIPELERLIGKQPTVTELEGGAAQNRFNLLFGKFLRIFATKEHPLVIFLDDLQWADLASLKLIQLLMADTDTHYLLLIGAYRDNEVSPAHPLRLTLEEIHKNNDHRATCPKVNQIVLEPLGRNNLNRLIADTLSCPLERAVALTELVFNKTKGNPFFTNQLLKSLYQDGLIFFNFSEGYWQCDIAKVRALSVSSDVVEFMASQLQKLPENTQNVLKLAACIGNSFDLSTLAIVHEKSQAETADDLWRALQEGFVLPISEIYKFFHSEGNESTSYAHATQPFMGNREELSPLSIYKFLHDRVQQASYFLIPEADKQSTHLKIGQLLLSNTTAKKREENIFDIVNQLNMGVELIHHQTERDELAELNLVAGRKAKASTAYAAALRYLTVGMELLAADSWESQYNLTLALYVEAAEAAYLSTDFQKMEQLVELVLQQANALLDRVKVYEVKMLAYVAQNKLMETVKTGLQVLKLLGITLPENPTKLNVLLGLFRTKCTLWGKQIEDLTHLPEMTDPNQLAAMRILSTASTSAYFAVPLLLPLIVFKQVNLSLKYGNASSSSYAYVGYGLVLCGIVGNIETGFKFGQLSLNVLARFNAKELKARILQIVNSFISHWKKPVQETLAPLLEAYQSGLETGDLQYAAYSAYVYCSRAYFSGRNLAVLAKEFASYNQAIANLKQVTALNYNQIYEQVVLNLIGEAENPCHLMGKSYNEQTRLPLHQQANDSTAMCVLYINKLILCYLFQEYQQAFDHAILAEKYIGGVTSTLPLTVFHFYDSLARLAILNDATQSEKKQLLRKVQANQKKMKKWAHHAPMNYLHKFYLVEAERCRLLGKNVEAMHYYDRAISLAQANDYVNEEALANELAAQFYLAWDKDKIAQVYLTDAYYAYARWGAKAKIEDLEKRYPQLLAPILNRETVVHTGETLSRMANGTLNSSHSGNSAALDLGTVIKASQALSGEIQFHRLLSTLMQVVIENAGASKGSLILQKANNWVVEAIGISGQLEATVLQSIPIESSQEIPASLINYVSHTAETLVINDATIETTFAADPYIIQHQPKSILCTPIINQGKVIGILYLENNLAPGAFTSNRLEVLKVLSSQTAISIENAKLYSEVKDSERRLTQFLEAMPVGVAILDAFGKPYYANRVAVQLLGKGAVPEATTEQLAEVYQNYIAGTEQLYPSENLPLVRALRGESATVDDIEIHQGDKIIPIEGWGTPIFDEKGNISYAIVAFQDITERKKAEAERERFTSELFQLNQAFSHFVPRQFLQFLDKSSIVDVKLGDQVQKEMSVLFSDIRDFTKLSERMTPQNNFKFINAYLSRMEPAIVENGGFIDKYIGDGIMALFSGSADDAVKAGIAMLHRLAEYNQHRSNSGYIPIQIGIGINTGSLMLGTVGGHNRMDGTVISDAVNLASRVEQLTKNYQVSLLITHQTLSHLENPAEYAIRLIDQVKVQGKSEWVTLYEVFDADAAEVREGKLATAALFQEALSLYNQHSFQEAAQRFEDCLYQNPGDKVAQIYLKRCRQM